eukprot:Protomagalhaensia_wolfi_Nauph_80__284@NODE_115_length_3600_cov_79_402977_g88_i0_p1_GENE_NODE_115_length_3600_cov_79_402977_g88_i0NODE_115_length_3600_cov_79_402977_g88_i0_p1_ORF_typecomplete_len299_score35_11TPT/PF03151_16/4_8e41EamA/PF00892_20/8_1e10EamA/PF00892_20/7_3e06UAA/PF08449_11/2_9e15CRTlike/PF08627_10/4_1e10CRTlike/PF08627_10/0_23PUNUT/PF16913_5/7_3e10Nuc_sug_transp/PF04142_15/0_00048Nuc_sug_transp/PF04142_15/0_044SLC35F/PF06027_12/2_6e06Multi_Drug_Res/PF00893_19/0_0031Multi_Drug_Res/P
MNAKQFAFGVYAVSSAAFVLGNRALLLNHKRPLTVTCCQQAIVSILYIAYQAGWRREFPFDRRHLFAALPCAASFLLMVALNNVCLSYASVVGYTIARASTIVHNLVLSYLFLQQKASPWECVGCALVTAAVLFNSKVTESKLEFVGLAIGILASLSQAVFTCSVAAVLRRSKLDPLKLQGHYTAVATTALLVAVGVLHVEDSDGDGNLPVRALLIMGLLNAVVAVSAMTSLSVSNPVTVNLIGYFKSIIQAGLAWVLFHDPLTPSKCSALTCTATGTLIYSLARQNRAKAKDKLKEK